jgi:hypothetical protein
MIFEQPEGDRLERPGNRRDLSQDIDAVDVLVDHPLQTADLSLDPAKALQIGVFVLAVTVHASPYLVLGSHRLHRFILVSRRRRPVFAYFFWVWVARPHYLQITVWITLPKE